MEYYCIFVILICVFVSADCRTLTENGEEGVYESLSRAKRESPRKLTQQNVVTVPTYAMAMIGFIMIIMFLAIIGLAVALYLTRKNKQLFGSNVDSRQYVRQESTGVIPLYNNSNYEDNNKNNGSTLTVNSGVIEISESRVSEPETPVRLEDSKIVFTKKPINPIVPVMPRVQMDAICKEVLKRVQKSDSASFRDLNELLNAKNEDKSEDKCDTVEESPKEVKEEEKIESKIQAFEKIEPKIQAFEKIEPKIQSFEKIDSKSQAFEKIEAQKPKPEVDVATKTEPEKESEMEIEKDVKEETESKPTNEIENKLQPEVKNEVQIDVPKVEIDKSADVSDTETEYDTVPSPIPYRHSGPEAETYETDDGFQLYDLPPRRSHEGVLRNVIQLDQDSQYLLAISSEDLESCYVNAKTPKLK